MVALVFLQYTRGEVGVYQVSDVIIRGDFVYLAVYEMLVCVCVCLWMRQRAGSLQGRYSHTRLVPFTLSLSLFLSSNLLLILKLQHISTELSYTLVAVSCLVSRTLFKYVGNTTNNTSISPSPPLPSGSRILVLCACVLLLSFYECDKKETTKQRETNNQPTNLLILLCMWLLH